MYAQVSKLMTEVLQTIVYMNTLPHYISIMSHTLNYSMNTQYEFFFESVSFVLSKGCFFSSSSIFVS
jgi:hypothetical protein